VAARREQRDARHERIRTVKFQPDSLDGVNTIVRHEGTRVWVGSEAHGGNVVVPWRGLVRPWSATSFEAMRAADFDTLLEDNPEVVIFGSGTRLRFPKPALLRGLIERRIGVESMDTAAACRTYNVLVSEGRTVVAALLLEPV
jgi:uncharacterized protein